MAYNQFYNPYQQVNPAMLQQQQIRLQQQIDQMYPQYQQQQMPQMQQSGAINGRVVDSIDSVMANEVPMTGEVALFPTRDMQSIYAKQWQSDGTIKTVRYALINDMENMSSDNKEQAQSLSDSLTEGIMERLNSIEQKIDSIGKKTTIKSKKESDES